MHLLPLLTAITSLMLPVSSMVAAPAVTPKATLAARQQINSICGYYSDVNGVESITCADGQPCMVATGFATAVGYCGLDTTPVTTMYGYGYWPDASGCSPGAACCPSSLPDAGEVYFNGGATVFLVCGPSAVDASGFFSEQATFTPVPSPVGNAATPTNAQPSSSSSFSSSQTPSSSNHTTVDIVIIVVGGAVALAGFFIFCYFLHKAILAWRAPPWSYRSSTAAQAGTGRLDRWSKWSGIVGPLVIAPLFGIAGLAVALYFGLHPQSAK